MGVLCTEYSHDGVFVVPRSFLSRPKLLLKESTSEWGTALWKRKWGLDEARTFLTQICTVAGRAASEACDAEEGSSENDKTVQGTGEEDDGGDSDEGAGADDGGDNGEGDDGDITGQGQGGSDDGEEEESDDEDFDFDEDTGDEEEDDDDSSLLLDSDSDELSEDEQLLREMEREARADVDQEEAVNVEKETSDAAEINVSGEKSVTLASGKGIKQKLEDADDSSSPKAKKQKTEN